MSSFGLRRELRLWEAVALSIGIMAPTSAMALNGVLPAQQAGRAVPLVFLIGFVGVGFIAYSFARLTKYFSHAGSVYVLAGRSLGARAGFFGGFTLLGVYVVFAVSAFAAAGLFFTTFLADVGVKANVPWLLISLIVMALVLMLCIGQVRVAARTLLVFEAIGIVLVAILVIVIFVKTGSGSAPQHQTFDIAHAFSPTVGLGPVVGASVYAFLSWAGFEGAATLGEETANAKRNIPRAIVWSVGAIGVFYVITMLAETLGFGTSAAGVHAFGSAAAPFSSLSHSYIGSPMADALDLAMTASQIGCALACSSAAARILFALARDGFGPAFLGRALARTGSPFPALVVVIAACAAFSIGQRLAGTSSPDNVYFYYATIGVLALLVVYAVTAVGALRFLFLTGQRRAPLWEIVCPVVGTVYLVYVYYKQVVPVPASPYNLFPYIAAGWMVLALLIIFARPALARRIGKNLISADKEAEPESAPLPAGPAASGA